MSSYNKSELNYFFVLLFKCLYSDCGDDEYDFKKIWLKLNDRCNFTAIIFAFNSKQIISRKKLLSILQNLDIILLKNYAQNVNKIYYSIVVYKSTFMVHRRYLLRPITLLLIVDALIKSLLNSKQ